MFAGSLPIVCHIQLPMEVFQANIYVSPSQNCRLELSQSSQSLGDNSLNIRENFWKEKKKLSEKKAFLDCGFIWFCF